LVGTSIEGLGLKQKKRIEKGGEEQQPQTEEEEEGF